MLVDGEEYGSVWSIMVNTHLNVDGLYVDVIVWLMDVNGLYPLVNNG